MRNWDIATIIPLFHKTKNRVSMSNQSKILSIADILIMISLNGKQIICSFLLIVILKLLEL